jgi:ribosomal protein S18 acetylase RimI-like enzyme
MMIRAAEERDAPLLAELITQLGYATTAQEMTERLRAILSDQNFATFVAVEENEVCGMIGLSTSMSYEHNDRTGRIIALVVHEKMRRRGIGRKLIAAAEDYFSREQVTRLTLTTRFAREKAHKFYEALGYVRTGLRFMKQLPGR